MSAYNKGELSIEAYLVRILAALCRQNGGEIRVKGELIDTVGEATALLKAWDGSKQELVLTVSMGTFGEVFRVVPEKHNQGAFVFPSAGKPSADGADTENPKRSGSTLMDDQKLSDLERLLTKRRVAAMLKDEMKKRGGAQP